VRRYLSVSVLAVLAVGLARLPVTVQAQNDPASRALRYLASQQLADGSVPGFSPAQATEDFAIAAAGAGYDPTTLKASSGTSDYDYLSAPANLSLETAEAGGTGRLIEAVVAGRLDPTNFGGENLVTKLQTFDSSGAYAAGLPFSQALAMLGLVAAGQPVPANAITYLHSLRNGDGGWGYASGQPSDSNDTAIALMALDAAGDHADDAAALTNLHTYQATDGGFQYQAGAGSDADSDALGIQAVVATGQDPAGAAWALSGQTPYGWLLATQDAATGGFGYGGSPDPGTTSQVPAGLELQPFPVHAIHGAGNSLAVSRSAGVRALEYLNGQQAADGSLGGLSLAQATEDFAIGAAEAGYDPKALSDCGATVYGYLGAKVASITADAGSTGRLVEAVVAGRLDPTNFGGQNLVSKLQSFDSGGAYAAGQPFSQALAMLGLVAAGQPVPANAVTYLDSLRNGDGGWGYASGQPSDSNDTAIALMTLDAAGDHADDAAALANLHTYQATDGGFQYQAGYGSDVDSDALVLQALMGARQDPAATIWAQGSLTVLTHLAANQNADGGFGYQSTTSDPGTTSSVPEGLERLPFPVGPAFYTDGARLPNPPVCPSPSPSPTATPAPTRTPTPAAVATPTPAPAQVATPMPSPSVEAPSPSPSPSPSASATIAPAFQPGPTAAASHPTGSGGLPAPLVYLFAALGGLGLVVVAGAVYLLLVRRA